MKSALTFQVCLLIAVALAPLGIKAEDAHHIDAVLETHGGNHGGAHSLELSDEAVPWPELGNTLPERPQPVTERIEDLIFESNRERKALIKQRNETGEDIEVEDRKTLFGRNPFLGQGEIAPGFEIPTGAVWQPVVIIYGEVRTAIQTFDNDIVDVTEWANRFDLFTNVYLTPTERFFFGFRPLDRRGDFTGYRFDGNQGEGWEERFNFNVNSLYFEGDFGELFPNLDPEDDSSLDYGFAIGRMPLNFQDGIMINDSIDAIGISRASLFGLGSSAMRITGLFGLNEVHRGNNVRDSDAFIYGLFFTADYLNSTYDLDFCYVDGDPATGGDGFYAGIGQTRRFGKINSTLRANVSVALDEQTPAIDDGVLLFSQLSRTMDYNNDNVYLNTFYGIDNYTSAARDPAVGGPLGGTGILFAAVGLGEYGAGLGNRANESVGAALGYQHFLDDLNTKQLVAEVGGRAATDGDSRSGVGFGLRYQQALNQHLIFVLDGFVAGYDGDETGHGVRCELRMKF